MEWEEKRREEKKREEKRRKEKKREEKRRGCQSVLLFAMNTLGWPMACTCGSQG